MVIGIAWAAFGALLVYATASWWGAEALSTDRRAATLLTLMAGVGITLVWPQASFWAVILTAILAVVAVVDRRHHIIPNRLTAVALIWGAAVRFYEGRWLLSAILGMAIFLFYLMVHVVTHGGLGMGDVKLAGVLAFGLGYPAGLVSMVAGMWAAGLYALFLIAARRRGTGVMALGPFLAFGGFVGLLDLVH